MILNIENSFKCPLEVKTFAIKWPYISDIEEDGWLVREDLLLDAHNWSIDGVVDVWQVGLSWTLSHSTELIVHGTVTEANPTLVSSEIWHWNTSKMGANGRADQDLRVSSWRKGGLRLLIEEGSVWESLGVLDLSHGKSSN